MTASMGPLASWLERRETSTSVSFRGKIYRWAAICCILLAAATTNCWSQEMPPDIGDIEAGKQLVVGMTKFDNLPFYGVRDGELIGIDVDIARQIGKVLGVAVRFDRSAASFQDVVQLVIDGKVHAGISKLSITPGRMKTVSFSAPYLELRQAVLVNRLWLSQNGADRDLAEVVRGYRGSVGLIAGTSYEAFSKINFPRATYIPRTNWDEVLGDVMSGRTGLAYRDEFEVKRVFIDRPDSSISVKSVVLTDNKDYIAVAVGYRSSQLLQIINFVLRDKFSSLNVDRVIARYNSLVGGH